MRKATLLAVTIALALTGAACTGEDEPTIQTQESPKATVGAKTFTGSVQASNQSSDGTTLTVASVTIIGGSGFIAVHTDSSGAPGPVVGHSDLLKEGTYPNVVVKLDKKVATADFWPMLHADDNGDGKYTFSTDPTTDKPVPDEQGKPVMMKITLTVT